MGLMAGRVTEPRATGPCGEQGFRRDGGECVAPPAGSGSHPPTVAFETSCDQSLPGSFTWALYKVQILDGHSAPGPFP